MVFPDQPLPLPVLFLALLLPLPALPPVCSLYSVTTLHLNLLTEAALKQYVILQFC